MKRSKIIFTNKFSNNSNDILPFYVFSLNSMNGFEKWQSTTIKIKREQDEEE